MKKTIFWVLIALLFVNVVSATAQETSQEERMPIVNGGLKLQANASNFWLKNIPTNPNLRSTMNAGGELGGFIDFNISKNFFIQFNLMLFAEHSDLHNDNKKDKMWTLGLEIPVYLLGRYGNPRTGYVYFGGGPFTEFALWGELKGSTAKRNPYKHIIDGSNPEEEAYAFADNYSGLAAYVGYELPCRLQFNASYQFGISDMLLFEHDKSTHAHTQKVTLGLAYRFK